MLSIDNSAKTVENAILFYVQHFKSSVGIYCGSGVKNCQCPDQSTSVGNPLEIIIKNMRMAGNPEQHLSITLPYTRRPKNDLTNMAPTN